jgi:hypothetical protein
MFFTYEMVSIIIYVSMLYIYNYRVMTIDMYSYIWCVYHCIYIYIHILYTYGISDDNGR